MPQLNNDFWRLTLNAKFLKTKRLYEQVPCDCGRGSQFMNMYDERPCSQCHDTGMMNKESVYPPAPKIPDDFIEYMTKAYNEYVNKE